VTPQAALMRQPRAGRSRARRTAEECQASGSNWSEFGQQIRRPRPGAPARAGLKPERGAGSAVAAERSGGALILRTAQFGNAALTGANRRGWPASGHATRCTQKDILCAWDRIGLLLQLAFLFGDMSGDVAY
jgi:hypothetical protein